MIDRSIIGEKIKQARKNKKLSQFKLAEMIGVDEKQIYRIEAGLSSPKLENFLKIADILDLKLQYFENVPICKKYMNEIIELLNNASDNKRKLFLNILKTLDACM